MLLAVSGCSLIGTPVALRTEERPSDGCLLALMGGTLARNAETGLGVDDLPVLWPFGYAARSEFGRIVLLDETGTVIAREGDQIEVGGGGDEMWHACRGVTVTKQGP